MEQKTFNFLSWTWGILMSLIGLIVFLVLRPFCGKPKRYGNCLYFEVGNYWGGLEFGWLFLVDKQPDTHVMNHEYGHGIQNIKYGPAFMVLWIWGILRYWYRNIVRSLFHKSLPPYDSIWFEGEATELGAKWIEHYEENNKTE